MDGPGLGWADVTIASLGVERESWTVAKEGKY